MATADWAEKAALVALLRIRPAGLNWEELTARVMEIGSAVALWEQLVPPTLFDTTQTADDPLRTAAADLAGWDAQGLTVLSVLDGRYPASLRAVHQAPPVLFTRGRLLDDDLAVSVVGSRVASDRGLSMASSITKALVADDVTAVAGLALGIDTAVHRSALDAGGRTVAVLGNGLNKVYPAVNRDLQGEVADRGLLVSQFWPDAPPQKHTFLMRNATMSGYSLATVVVEAGEKSGTRVQARLAVEHGRPVILTDSVVRKNEWARGLIDRPGVYQVGSVREVLDVINFLKGARVSVSDEKLGQVSVSI
ncbi:DNA-processing protein DprA [Amycolatopsis magusensis]|uniref:DNA-processing protein DprA n=1 Tax=Amycolatopsis magusensis TaxID=882444 RepID=UPI0024A8F1F2|nr:DNA-processing protein DprA [Amycolatopsis magusensis]MDI5978772.1 DNA-processing protein DprA [Amycolatopsis magusensis]